jgi:hypothetical protein
MRRLAVLCVVLGALLVPPSAHAGAPEAVQVEVKYLLDFVEISGCQFYRNGSWHDSSKARSHLLLKFEYLDTRNLVKTAEDFIDNAATKSSMSGRLYEIRCLECKSVPTGPWLHDVLSRYRVVVQRDAARKP